LWSIFPKSYVSGSGTANVKCLYVDESNNIYTTGSSHNADLDPGIDTLVLATGTFIQKLDANGNLQWAKSYGGIGYGATPLSFSADTFGNIYSTGVFNDSTNLDPGPDTLVFYTQSNINFSQGAYLQKLNSNGNLLWAGVLQGNSGRSQGFDIKIDNAGNVYATGNYVDTVDFDPSSSIHNLVSANPPWASSYILKLSQCKVLASDNVIACDSLIWIDGKTYYQSTQSAYFTLPSSVGCDSIICLNLNIPQIDTTISLSTNGASFIANQSNAKYQWLDCNNGYTPLLGDTLQIFTPTVNGDYAVEINLDACVDTSACVNINNVSIKETQLSGIKLYPNPNSGKFILDMGKLKAREIKILNSIGQEIFVVKDVNSQLFSLNLKPGVYIVQIFTANENRSLRFVVE
jgi:hypothetical protein